tara:strand:- start:1160 stop:1951 length:792 start_codon:yes stop_codon:yes gene_type:complete
MAGWFGEQNVGGYSDWLAQERNLNTTQSPGAGGFLNPNAPKLNPDGTYSTPPPGTIEQIAPGTAPPGGLLPPVASAPYNSVQTGGGQYPLAAMAGEGWMRPWTNAFTAPTQEGLADNPAFKFRMEEGSKAIERSAAAKGVLGTARPMKDLMRWGQGLASEEYDKVYNRSLGEYRQAYDIYGQNQANQFNRLSGMAGTGQSAANTLGQQGTSYAGQGSEAIYGAGNANAAGRVGSANAWNQGISSIGDDAMMLALMRQQQQPGY